MSNVLDDEKQQQIRALGRLGWTLSRIQEATGVRRETISGYLKAAGHCRAEPRPSKRIETKTGNFPRGVHRLDRGHSWSWTLRSGCCSLVFPASRPAYRTGLTGPVIRRVFACRCAGESLEGCRRFTASFNRKTLRIPRATRVDRTCCSIRGPHPRGEAREHRARSVAVAGVHANGEPALDAVSMISSIRSSSPKAAPGG
jgi:hypothetical protein